jgi:hypothetical protein
MVQSVVTFARHLSYPPPMSKLVRPADFSFKELNSLKGIISFTIELLGEDSEEGIPKISPLVYHGTNTRKR